MESGEWALAAAKNFPCAGGVLVLKNRKWKRKIHLHRTLARQNRPSISAKAITRTVAMDAGIIAMRTRCGDSGASLSMPKIMT